MTHWWPLDEQSGTTATDIVNPLTNGTHVNGPIPVPGMVAGGLSFDGVDDYVEVLHDSSLDFGTGDLTIDAWIKPDPNNYSNSSVMTLVDHRVEPEPLSVVGVFALPEKRVVGLSPGTGGRLRTLYPHRPERLVYELRRDLLRVSRGSGITSPSRWIGTARRGGKFYVDGTEVGALQSDGPAGLADEPRPAPAGQPLILPPSAASTAASSTRSSCSPAP